MGWKGITDDKTDVGSEQKTVQNASYYVAGELRRRPGIGGRFAQGGIVVTEQYPYLIFATSAGALVSNDGTTATTLQSGYNVVKRPVLQPAFGRTYIINDFNAMLVSDDGVTIRSAGITAPVASPGPPTPGSGVCDVGLHSVRYRWYDSRRMRYSNPSGTIPYTCSVQATNGQATYTNLVSSDPTVDTIIYEMTPVDSGFYYQVGTTGNTAGTFSISISDADLVNRTSTLLYGDFGHNPPPLASILAEHQGYMFQWGATTRTFTPVTVTSGSPTITGTGFSTQWAGRQVKVTGSTTTYYINSATTTAITLSANYVGSTNAAATITVTSGSPNLLTWSQPAQPESWDTTELARLIALGSGDQPSALLSLHGDLYLIGQRSMRRMNIDSDGPGAAQIIPVPTTLGAYHPRCVMTDAGNLGFGWGRDGIWLISAMLPEKISEPIIDTINGIADLTKTDERFCVWEPVSAVALFFFVATGDTACKYAAAFSVETKTWQLWKYRQPMTCGCATNYTDAERTLLTDENDSSWRIGINVNDGIDNGTVLAGAGSSTTVVNATGAVVGMVVYRPLTAEERRITVAGPTSFTVSTAFATAPATGETLYLGSVPMQIVTEWFIADGLAFKKRPKYLLLSVRPSAVMGTVRVVLYKDFSYTGLIMTDGPDDTWPEGVTPVAGQAYIEVDLDTAVGSGSTTSGFVAIPITSDWSRAIAAQVTADQPEDVLRFLDLSWSVDGKPQQALAEGE